MPLTRRALVATFGAMFVAGGGTAGAGTSLRHRFDYLSGHGNSNCSVEFFESIRSMPPGTRLRGSCCGPMDFNHYKRQIDGLKAYASVAEIPPDPYDIRAGLAQRLIAADEQVLAPVEQAVFDGALAVAEEGGPCCCQCWRWTAYGGLAKKLIRERGFSAEAVARVWDLSSGCGG